MIGAGVEHSGQIPMGFNVAHAGIGSHFHYQDGYERSHLFRTLSSHSQSVVCLMRAARGSPFNHLPGPAGYGPELRSACP